MHNHHVMTWFDDTAEPILYPRALFLHLLFLTPGYTTTTAPLVIALVFMSLLSELTRATELTEKYPQKISPPPPSSQLPKRAS